MSDNADISNLFSTELAVKNNASLESAFINLQRNLLAPIIGEKNAKNATNYFEAGGPTGLMTIFSPKSIVEYLFITQAILGKEISKKINKYPLILNSSKEKNSPKIQKIIKEKYIYFNPDVVYNTIISWPIQPDQKRIGDSGPNDECKNFFVLYKKDLNNTEINDILQRGSIFQGILKYSEKHYAHMGLIRTDHYGNIRDPWANLRIGIETLMIKLDNTLKFDFIQEGIITKWQDSDRLGYNATGYVAKVDDEHSYVMQNIANKEKFKHLIGKTVLFHEVPNMNLDYTGNVVAIKK